MRKSSVCFLHFLHPSLIPDCSMCLKGKSFPNPSSLKYHQMEQKETELTPEAFPPWNVLDAPAPELWLQRKSEQQDVHAVCGGADQRASHASGTAGNYLAEQNPSCNVMMWGLMCQHQLTGFFLILCPCLPISIPWGTILVAGRIQFSTDCTEA